MTCMVQSQLAPSSDHVGVATVYRHFATVAELEEALVWERFEALGVILRDAEPG